MAGKKLAEKIGTIPMLGRTMILLGTLLLLAGAFAALYYIPKKEDISRLRTDLNQLEQRLKAAKIKQANLAKFEKQQAQVEDEFQKALLLLPDKKEIPRLLRSITELGSDANLEFRLFNPKQERPQTFYIEIPVAMELGGGYHEVASFFDKVGRTDRIINILNVSMRPMQKRSTTLITRCDLVTYRFKGEADAKAEKE
jgi:type IV pilus assembly protein PilO